jgi:hypothetical protein
MYETRETERERERESQHRGGCHRFVFQEINRRGGAVSFRLLRENRVCVPIGCLLPSETTVVITTVKCTAGKFIRQITCSFDIKIHSLKFFPNESSGSHSDEYMKTTTF